MRSIRSSFSGVAVIAAALVTISFFVAAPSIAAEHKGMAMAKGGMDRFLIISPHTAEQCLAVLDDMAAKEPQMLAKTDWGCMAGDHTAYMIVEAKDEMAAKNKVPQIVRDQAKVIKLNKFTAEQIKSFHQKS
jgi:hypothetical protein